MSATFHTLLHSKGQTSGEGPLTIAWVVVSPVDARASHHGPLVSVRLVLRVRWDGTTGSGGVGVCKRRTLIDERHRVAVAEIRRRVVGEDVGVVAFESQIVVDGRVVSGHLQREGSRTGCA